jgi:glycosyltransferase involved in cell wall biosynthesis
VSSEALRILGIADADYIHTQKWASFFASRGHAVHLLSFNPISPEGRAALHSAVVVEPWVLPSFHLKRAWITLSALKRLRATSGRVRPDVVHVHFLGHAGWYAALAGLGPLVISIMGGDLRGSVWQPASLRERVLTPLVLRRARKVLCWSRGLTRCVAPLLRRGFEPEVLVGGVDLDQFKPSPERDTLRARLRLQPDSFLILSPRLHWPHYNIGCIVRALPLVLEQIPGARLLLVKYRASSYPEYDAHIEGLVDSLGVRHAVLSMAGIPNSEMPGYFSAADCTVSIPNSDGTPMTVMESSACGTPVIVLDLDDYDRDTLEHRRTVLRIPAADPQELAGAILQLATSPERRREIALGAMDMVRRSADYQGEMSRLEAIYQTIAGRRP